MLATAGGLVFSGAGKGRFAAFDAASGRELWTYHCDAGVNAPPVTYEIGTRQYVAVAVGGNALFGFIQGDMVMAFALPERHEASVLLAGWRASRRECDDANGGHPCARRFFREAGGKGS